MFPYDSAILVAAASQPYSIAGVVELLQFIDSTCEDGDGLKWFNWLYLQVTQAVEARVASGDLADSTWLAELDVQFARLYLEALESALAGRPAPGCWQSLFDLRGQTAIARIQFALAGINAHINHDLSMAIVATCEAAGTTPQHACPQYRDYTAINSSLDSIIESAKQTLHVRLLGDALPAVTNLEDVFAAWSVSAARESAWNHSEILWHLRAVPPLSDAFMDTIDGLTTVASKVLLVPVP